MTRFHFAFVVITYFTLWSGSGVGEIPPLAVTQTGVVSGKALPNGTAYLGIPFAMPPTGLLRWRAPQPPLPWLGVRAANKLPEMCAQRSATIGSGLGNLVGSEDCLYLNVWIPPGTPATAKLPVMTFVHGGGLSIGSTTDFYLDGAALAAKGKVIVVTVQYRLGVLGYLAHPALSAETSYGSSGNYGLLDQAASLRWVQNNIANFGGDPKNVTLFGESGGAASVCALVSSPLTKGLFARAIMESGGQCRAMPKAVAEQDGLITAFKAGCLGNGPLAAACLRSRPLDAVTQIPVSEMVSTKDFRRTTAVLAVDNYALPDEPIHLIRAGKGQPVPMIVGNNDEEGLFFVPYYLPPAKLQAQIVDFFGAANADKAYALYPAEKFASEVTQGAAIFADYHFDCGSRNLARAKSTSSAAPVYRYLYDFKVTLFGKVLPAFHGSELPFVFQTMERFKGGTLTPEEQKVSETFFRYWTQFAKTGNPNSVGSPPWEKFETGLDNFLVINDRPAMQRQRHSAQCDMWSSIVGH